MWSCCPRLSPQTCCVSCSSHTPFCSCFLPLALRAQTDTKHERQCAPHDGSLATVCRNSRGSGVVHIWRFLKQKMPLILLSDISYLTSSSSSLQIVLENLPNCLRKRISQRAPANDEEFLFVLWRWNSRKRGALWRTRFLLCGRFIGMFSTRKLAIIVGNPLSTYFFLTRPLPSGKFILFIWKYWLFPQTRYNNSRFVYYY